MKKGIRTRAGLEHFQHRDEFGGWLGYECMRADKKSGRAVFAIQIRRDHLSPSGRVHGGVVSSTFDAALGVAVFTTLSPSDFTATIELKVNYLRPLFEGDRAKIKAEVVFRGRRLAVGQAMLYVNGGKKPAAMATGTFAIMAEGKGRHAPKERRKREIKAAR